jgi:hypothetical protein
MKVRTKRIHRQGAKHPKIFAFIGVAYRRTVDEFAGKALPPAMAGKRPGEYFAEPG